ncbi:hypothetical protein [Paenibacillus sp. MMO-58]|uniref:hypothetical protein n=1 Tax=Paenibacillus sp. MMO-58 TaxID=3081290 RepID=UPI00301AFBB9
MKKETQQEYLSTKAAQDVMLQAYYAKANEISSEYPENCTDEQFEEMDERQEALRSEIGIDQIQTRVRELEEELLSQMKEAIHTERFRKAFATIGATPKDLEILFTQGVYMLQTRAKLLKLATMEVR